MAPAQVWVKIIRQDGSVEVRLLQHMCPLGSLSDLQNCTSIAASEHETNFSLVQLLSLHPAL